MDEKQARIAAECFRKANDALNRKQWDYAADMYQKCVLLSPANLTYRQALRGSEYRKYEKNGTGAGSLAKMKIGGLRSKAKKARDKEQYGESSKLIEQALFLNPWDPASNHELSQTAMAAEWDEVAEFAASCAWQADKNNEDLSQHLADVLESRRKYKEAAQVYEHLSKLVPGNGEYRSQISRMLTKHTTEAAKFEEAERSIDLREDGQMADHEVNKRIGKDPGSERSLEDQLAAATRKEPDNYENWQKYTAQLLKLKKFEKALEAAKKALELREGDAAAEEMKEDAELGVLRTRLSTAKDENADKAELAEIGKALLKREIEVLTNRVKRYPQDMGHKYELAQRLMRIKKYPAAIPLLQKSSQSPKYKAKSLVSLGKCFLKENKASLAKGQFERALPELNVDNDAATVIETHYLLGRIYEQLKNPEKAEEHYGEVLVLDYDYEDAKDRLEGLQAGE